MSLFLFPEKKASEKFGKNVIKHVTCANFLHFCQAKNGKMAQNPQAAKATKTHGEEEKEREGKRGEKRKVERGIEGDPSWVSWDS